MPFKPGQSGNPKGRPPKSRALTTMLEKAGKTKFNDTKGNPTAAKTLFAQRVWEGLATGQITFPDGRVLKLEFADFMTLTRLVLNQIDGPPPQNIELPDGSQSVAFNIIGVPARAAPPSLEDLNPTPQDA